MSGIHFSIGSAAGQESALKHALENTRRPDQSPSSLDLSQDLALVKASLMYADRVTLYSLGSSILSGIADYQESSTEERARIAIKFLPYSQPETPSKNLELLEAAVGLRGRSAKRDIAKRDRQRLLALADDNRGELDKMVLEQHRDSGIEGFREAVGSGVLHVHAFRQVSIEALIEATVRGNGDLLRGIDIADVIREYIEQTSAMIGSGNTYPVFDDLTGDFVAECVQNGLIAAPPPDAGHRSRYGGLAADLLERLPLFERATLAEALDIRRELENSLMGFRLAVAGFSREIAPAGWDSGFADEAEALFRERVEPEIQRIEAAVSDNNDLRRFTERAAEHGVSGAFIGAVVGSVSDLSNLAAVASGLAAAGLRAEIDRRQTMKDIEGNQLYFFYRAGRRTSGA